MRNVTRRQRASWPYGSALIPANQLRTVRAHDRRSVVAGGVVNLQRSGARSPASTLTILGGEGCEFG
jgi:hypothetical protein